MAKEKEEIKTLKEELDEIKSLLKDILEELKTSDENEDFFKPYRLSDVDETGTIHYYGYLKRNGDWIIEAYNTSTGERRFAICDKLVKRTKAEKGYTEAWNNRENLKYRLFYDLFPEIQP
jgi:hypothetical protein